MATSKPKVHLKIQDFLSICGVHQSVKTFLWSATLDQVTCGNCLRKYSVFKWSPENPTRTKKCAFRQSKNEREETEGL